MITLQKYTKTDTDPTQSINPADFRVNSWYFDTDNQGKYLVKWDEDTESFEFLNFDKTLLWELNAPICEAKFDPKNQLVWLVQRDNDEQVTIFVYDYKGNQKASLMMEDEFYQSGFIITPLPQPMSIALDFAAGQDGSQAYFLQFSDTKIQVIKKLEENLGFLFTFDNDQKAILLNYYENTIFEVSYPDLEPLRQFEFPDDMFYGSLSKITDSIWLLTDGCSYRHYLFDSQTMQIIDEIVVSGYEPVMDKEGEISSNISGMEYADGKIIFKHWEFVGKYPNTKEKNWWGIADFDVENWK